MNARIMAIGFRFGKRFGGTNKTFLYAGVSHQVLAEHGKGLAFAGLSRFNVQHSSKHYASRQLVLEFLKSAACA
jgi:hypothetical protein